MEIVVDYDETRKALSYPTYDGVCYIDLIANGYPAPRTKDCEFKEPDFGPDNSSIHITPNTMINLVNAGFDPKDIMELIRDGKL